MAVQQGPWLEYPECPRCGALQEHGRICHQGIYDLRCPSCGQRFALRVQVTRRFQVTIQQEAE